MCNTRTGSIIARNVLGSLTLGPPKAPELFILVTSHCVYYCTVHYVEGTLCVQSVAKSNGHIHCSTLFRERCHVAENDCFLELIVDYNSLDN